MLILVKKDFFCLKRGATDEYIIKTMFNQIDAAN